MDELRETLRRHWGYETFRPLQPEAMGCVASGRDSVVVLPTGGGKSLCYQVPALLKPGLAVIVSPLISLMKDQVDALQDRGLPAACVNSSHAMAEKRQVADDIRAGRLKLLYLSPERLMTERTLDFLRGVPLSFFAIDEAHCISDWGHDFRPEYRMLCRLKETFPEVGVHAYTATATERVREDIARELRLKDPEILVGSFDRPNLVYRVVRRTDRMKQILEILGRHPNEAGIIYCIKRDDTMEVSAELQRLGHAALPYHAGMSDFDRKKNQEAFLKDQARLIVATVAFGMGIDKSDVRFVIHAGAPKSLEHYQQESGRAGRDGLEAECCLLYSPGDFATWRFIQRELQDDAQHIAQEQLRGIEAFCDGLTCRRVAVLRHFGQELATDNCGACDVCLGEAEPVADALIVAQKIISCVLRLKENFGGEYTSQALVGSKGQRIVANKHDQLSTHGLLSDHSKTTVRNWIEQLVRQGFLKKEGEFNVVRVTPEGRRVLRGEMTPRLTKPSEKPRKEARVAKESWEGVDRELFEALRKLRKEKADAKKLPPFVVFSDASLRDMARRRPSSLKTFRHIGGVGDAKCKEYGPAFVEAINDHCRERGLTQDLAATADSLAAAPPDSNSETKKRAYALFGEGKTIPQVIAATGRAPSTVEGYLIEFLEREAVTDPDLWLDAETVERVREANERLGGPPALRPLFEALGEQVSYSDIKIALTCLRNREAAAAA